MYPATVGGSTSGIVRKPSQNALAFPFRPITNLAAKIPRKKETNVAATPVFIVIQSGVKSRFCKFIDISYCTVK